MWGLLPIVVIVLMSLNAGEFLTFPPQGLSLRWFKAVFNHPDFVASFWNSLWLALLSATIATALAVPAGLALDRYEFPGRGALNGLFMSPLIIPHLVLGVAFLRLFALIGATGSFGWLIASHVIIILPYVLRLVLAALSGLDRSAEAAALTLGASPATVFRRITAPMILPGITGGWLLAFINSFDELTMSIFVTAPQTVTLPVRMYMYATESIDPMMAAVSALMIALTAAAMLLLDRAFGSDRHAKTSYRYRDSVAPLGELCLVARVAGVLVGAILAISSAGANARRRYSSSMRASPRTWGTCRTRCSAARPSACCRNRTR